MASAKATIKKEVRIPCVACFGPAIKRRRTLQGEEMNCEVEVETPEKTKAVAGEQAAKEKNALKTEGGEAADKAGEAADTTKAEEAPDKTKAVEAKGKENHEEAANTTPAGAASDKAKDEEAAATTEGEKQAHTN